MSSRGCARTCTTSATRSYGKPSKLCCRYLGPRSGERRWHVFEVWVDGREQGVVVMNEADLGQLIVTAAEPAKGARG